MLSTNDQNEENVQEAPSGHHHKHHDRHSKHRHHSKKHHSKASKARKSKHDDEEEIQVNMSSAKAENDDIPQGLNQQEIDEIADWLMEIGYSQYIDTFIENNVYGAAIAYLKDSHLKEMGITKIGHRVNLLKQAAKFKRAIKNINRNLEVLKEFHEWKALPEALQCWSRTFKLTSAAIVITTPRPQRCGRDVDNVDFSAVVDVNQKIGCCFRYIEILTTDKRFPKLNIRLRHSFGEKVFLAVRNLWEEDQIRIGVRHGKET